MITCDNPVCNLDRFLVCGPADGSRDTSGMLGHTAANALTVDFGYAVCWLQWKNSVVEYSLNFLVLWTPKFNWITLKH
jgi:hypothetical protein